MIVITTNVNNSNIIEVAFGALAVQFGAKRLFIDKNHILFIEESPDAEFVNIKFSGYSRQWQINSNIVDSINGVLIPDNDTLYDELLKLK